MKINIQQLTANQSDRVRLDFEAREIAKTLGRRNRTNGNGAYVGYDAADGLHSVQTDRGMVRGKFISNAGVAPGQKVVWSGSGAGTTFKTMPR